MTPPDTDTSSWIKAARERLARFDEYTLLRADDIKIHGKPIADDLRRALDVIERVRALADEMELSPEMEAALRAALSGDSPENTVLRVSGPDIPGDSCAATWDDRSGEPVRCGYGQGDHEGRGSFGSSRFGHKFTPGDAPTESQG